MGNDARKLSMEALAAGVSNVELEALGLQEKRGLREQYMAMCGYGVRELW